VELLAQGRRQRRGRADQGGDEVFRRHRVGHRSRQSWRQTCSNNGVATGGTGSLVNSQDGQVIGGQVVADVDGTPRTWQVVIYSNFTKTVPLKIWVVCAQTQ
jgi:hypothetical protein